MIAAAQLAIADFLADGTIALAAAPATQMPRARPLKSAAHKSSEANQRSLRETHRFVAPRVALELGVAKHRLLAAVALTGLGLPSQER